MLPRAWVQSLVGDLRSQKPCSHAKKKKKKKKLKIGLLYKQRRGTRSKIHCPVQSSVKLILFVLGKGGSHTYSCLYTHRLPLARYQRNGTQWLPQGRGIGGPGEGRARGTPKVYCGSQQSVFLKNSVHLLPYFCFNELQHKHNIFTRARKEDFGVSNVLRPHSLSYTFNLLRVLSWVLWP